MPELPDVLLYIDALSDRIVGQRIERIQLRSPFVLRSFDPPVESAGDLRVVGLERLGKRIVWVLEDDLFLVIHLMIAGRFQWRDDGKLIGGRNILGLFVFPVGILILTEAGTKKRASIHLVRGRENLAALDPGGLEVLDATFEQFVNRVTQSNHTLKRTLTSPRILSGIGNAYSDEILHRARMSPFLQIRNLSATQLRQLWDAIQSTLAEWIARLKEQTGSAFPKKVTAFRPDMAVHGRFGEPCPVCAAPIQRIVYAENESNYCPGCQTDGRILSDRSLARLLRSDWPKTLEELEQVSPTIEP